MLDGVSTYIPTPENVAATSAPRQHNTHAWKDGESFGFHDFLDTINPLQHIPIISTLYRWITGDVPGNVAEMVGDGIYGGPIGLGAGLFNVAFKEETGQSPGDMAIALITGGDTGAKLAQKSPSAPDGTADAAPSSTPDPAPAPVPAPAPAVATTAPDAAPATAATTAPAALFAGIPLVAAGAPRPPIPLPRSAAPPLPLPGSPSPAEQAFLDQKAAMQRNLYGPRPVQADHPVTAPIPLHLTGPALPQRAPRPAITPAAGTAPPAVISPALPPPLPVSALPDNAPVDISQRMMDALDKYSRMQQERQRGQSLDLSP
jgi:hypothetical protein